MAARAEDARGSLPRTEAEAPRPGQPSRHQAILRRGLSPKPEAPRPESPWSSRLAGEPELGPLTAGGAGDTEMRDLRGVGAGGGEQHGGAAGRTGTQGGRKRSQAHAHTPAIKLELKRATVGVPAISIK